MEKRELRSACTARENPTIKFVHRLNIFEAWVLHGQPKASIAAATYARKCQPSLLPFSWHILSGRASI